MSSWTPRTRSLKATRWATSGRRHGAQRSLACQSRPCCCATAWSSAITYRNVQRWLQLLATAAAAGAFCVGACAARPRTHLSLAAVLQPLPAGLSALRTPPRACVQLARARPHRQRGRGGRLIHPSAPCSWNGFLKWGDDSANERTSASTQFIQAMSQREQAAQDGAKATVRAAAAPSWAKLPFSIREWEGNRLVVNREA